MFGSSARVAAVTTVCRRRGCDELQTAAALRAVRPLDKGHAPADRELAKQLQAMCRRFAQTAHRAQDADELQELAYVVLSSYAYLARAAGDPYYTPLFEQAAFAVRVELDEERLEQVKQKL